METPHGNVCPEHAVELCSSAVSLDWPTERISVGSAVGRLLASPITLPMDSPPCDRSAMDGYAVRLAEISESQCLAVAGVSAPGWTRQELVPRTVIEVRTGAPIPLGADTVVRRECAVRDGDSVSLKSGAQLNAGADIRRRAEHAQAGSVLADAGTLITSATVSAATLCRHIDLQVRRQLRVGLIVSGQEFIQPDRALDINGPFISSLLTCRPWISRLPLTFAGDQVAELSQRICTSQPGCDVLLITGGCGPGSADFLRQAADDAGSTRLFDGLDARPGHPAFAALLGKMLLFGLPGNPVAAACVVRRVVLPSIARWMGSRCEEGLHLSPPTLEVPAKRRLILSQKDAAGRINPIASQDSANIVALGLSHGVCEVARDEPVKFYAWLS